ncbi:hypothetical protein GD1_167 [Paraglaciecola Antarctic GD virus 1]|nr:hypothetical protein GD1_167 [Paraglaciecola Antarctic GD virus 1]
MKKIIISPSHRHAEWWIASMGLKRSTVTIITPTTHGGVDGLCRDDIYAFLFEEGFDYPERNHHRFEDFRIQVERRLQYKI